MAARTLFASFVLHASVAVAIADGGREKKVGVTSATSGTIEVEESEDVEPPVTVPRDAPLPEEREPPSHFVVQVGHPRVARTETSFHPRKVSRVNPDGRGESNDAPDVVASEPGVRARFFMALGTGTTVTGGLAKSGAQGEGESETYAESVVSSRARLLDGPPPEYPKAARTAGVEADVPLELIVDASGTVVDARLLKHAGYGLDEAALRAVRAYRFIPAERAGHGVSVRMRWVVNFRLD